MIDDLVNKGVDEPYRMFTSRAEYRLQLREDNAEYRLTDKGYELGLINKARYERFCLERQAKDDDIARLKSVRITPSVEVLGVLAQYGGVLRNPVSAFELLKRPEYDYSTIEKLCGSSANERVREQVEINAKYEGYIERQENEIEKFRKTESVKIPDSIEYEGIIGLRREYIDKLKTIRPATLGQAARIKGMTPAAVALLHVHISKIKNSGGTDA
jgi:tRNA uridine 5-carboxymethylaminomethyl modification enzyme